MTKVVVSRKDLPEVVPHKPGNFYVNTKTGDVYILTTPDTNIYALISIDNGNRFTDPVTDNSSRNGFVPDDVFRTLCSTTNFTHIENVTISIT